MTPRTTRLIRARTLPAAHRAIAALARGPAPLAARDVAVLVPTRAAGLQLRRTLEALWFAGPGPAGDRVLVLPDILTRDDWYGRLSERVGIAVP